MRIFTGELSDELVKESLKLKNTRDWNLKKARKKAKQEKLENKIYPYAYRVFDNRKICYSFSLIEQGCDRWDLMKHFITSSKGNVALVTTRQLTSTQFCHSFITDKVSDMCFISNKGRESNYFFPLYLYPHKPKGQLFDNIAHQADRMSNFTSEFLQAIKDSLGSEPIPEEIFYYIYAVLYCSTYRKRYEEFLKIDFPSVPLLSNVEVFKELSNLGKELVDLHLLKAPGLDETEIGFPKGGLNKIERVFYNEENNRVFINKEQYFEGISKGVWGYGIGAYQVMEKYLKDRKGRKLSLDEINHYMKMAKAIRLTIELQEKIDDVYRKAEI